MDFCEKIFSAKKCERCGAPLKMRCLSLTSDEVICVDCKEAERKTSEYQEKAKELSALPEQPVKKRRKKNGKR